MDCPSCGAEVELGSAQCGNCGESLFDAPPPPPSDWLPGAPLFGRGSQPAPPKPRRNRVGCGCGAIVVTVVCIGLGAGLLALVHGAADVADSLSDAVDEGRRVDGEPLSLGRPVERHLDSDDTAVHPLAGIEGRVTITVAARDDGFDPVLLVSRPNGDVLGENDDADGLDSRLSLILSTSDDLRVEVREYSGDDGDYTVLVRRGDDVVGLSPIDGGRLALRTAAEGSVGRNQATAYDFTGEGREVVITVEGLDGFDPVVRVLDSKGEELGRNDDSDGSRDSRLPIVVAGASTVTVEVTGYAGAPGRYRILVH